MRDDKKDAVSARKFISRCILISGDAIADYQRAVSLDRCLKIIRPDAMPHEVSYNAAHDVLTAGERKEIAAEAPKAHPVFVAAILDALYQMDSLETRMRQVDPENWYSPHIMVRLDTIDAITALLRVLPNAIERLRDRVKIRNEGWRATGIWGGHKQRIPELHAQDSRQRWLHPFMISRNMGGKADDTCARILLLCNIGVRGINNWTVLGWVDCTTGASSTDKIQGDLGRPMRLPPNLSSWVDDDDKREFVSEQWFVPKVLWTEAKQKSFFSARDFVLDMENRVSEAGFRTWVDIAENRGAGTLDTSVRLTSQPFSLIDRLRLQNELGQIKADGQDITESSIQHVVNSMDLNGIRKERALAYGKRLTEEPDFSQEEVFATKTELRAVSAPVSPVTKLHPASSYDEDFLIQFVKMSADYDGIRDEFIREIRESRRTTIHSVTDNLRKLHEAIYREPSKTYTLHGDSGVLRELFRELRSQLEQSGCIKKGSKAFDGAIFSSVIGAAKTVFGIDKAKDDGPMDQHAYHVAIIADERRTILAIARGRFVRQNLPKMAALASPF